MPIFYPPGGGTADGGVYAGADGTTQTAGTVVWSNSNNISFGMNGSTITGSANAAASDHSHGNPTLALTNISGTTASASNGLTFSLSAGNYITTAALSNHSHGNPTLALTNITGTTASASNGFTLSLSAGAGGQGDGGNILAAGTRTAHSTVTVLFSNVNGISFGLDAVTGSVMTASHNALTTAMVSNAGSNFVAASAAFAGTSVSGTIASNGISVSVGPYLTTAAASNHSHGNPTLALTNLTGTTASASNGLTFSLSVGNYITTAALSNHSHGNPTLALTNLTGTTASASDGFTLSLSGNAPGGGAALNREQFEIMDGERLTTACPVTHASLSKRPIFVPFWMDGEGLIPKTIRLYGSRPAGTSLNGTLGVAFYSRANSTQITLHASATQAYSLTTSAQWSGVRAYEFTQFSSMTLSEGRWFFALYASGSNNSTAVMNLNFYGGDVMAVVAGSVHAGTNSTGATNNTNHFFPFWGVYSNTTAAFPAFANRTQIFGANSNVARDIYAVLLEI